MTRRFFTARLRPGRRSGCGAARSSVGRRAARHDAALLQHVGAARQRERHRDVLLDQQHRDAVGVDGPRPPRTRWSTIERRQAERRLVEQQQARAAPSARGRSPPSAAGRPRARPPPAARRSRSAGNSAYTRASDRARGARAPRRVAAELEVLAHRHPGEQPPALGHDRDARGAEAVRRQPGDVVAVEPEPPARARGGARRSR